MIGKNSKARGGAGLWARSGLITAIAWASWACSTETLSGAGSKVAATRNPAPAECKPLGYVVGRGGGTFGGGLLSNEDLIEYAMNDIRNKAGELGANYLQHDPPTLGQGDGTTTTATITGTAYSCPAEGSAN